MIPIGVITNITSGRNKQGKHIKRMLKSTFGKLAIVEKTSSVTQLPEVIERMKAHGIKILCIDGGDGTIQKVVTEWLSNASDETELPFLIPLRGGTSNATAHDFGIKGDSSLIAHKIREEYEKFLSGSIEELSYENRHVMKVEASFHSRVEYGFIVANGLIYNAVEKYQQRGEPSLRSTFTIIAEVVTAALMRNYADSEFFKMYEGQITVDGQRLSSNRFTGMIASTLNKLFFHIRPFYEENFNKEGFNFASLSIPAHEAVLHTYDIFRGRRSPNLPPDVLFNDRVKEVIIESNRGFMLDGELFSVNRQSTVKLTLGPQWKILKIPDVTFTDHFNHWKNVLPPLFTLEP